MSSNNFNISKIYMRNQERYLFITDHPEIGNAALLIDVKSNIKFTIENVLQQKYKVRHVLERIKTGKDNKLPMGTDSSAVINYIDNLTKNGSKTDNAIEALDKLGYTTYLDMKYNMYIILPDGKSFLYRDIHELGNRCVFDRLYQIQRNSSN